MLAIDPAGVDGLFLSVDEDRNIILEKRVKNLDLKKFLASPMRSVTQKSWEGDYFFKSHRKVIAVADSSLATTIPIPLDLPREPGAEKSEVVLPELENMIAQAMGKIFQPVPERGGASARYPRDGHDHGRREGAQFQSGRAFSGESGGLHRQEDISLLLELTFTGRALFEDLKQFFNAPEDFFFAESAQARLASLARARKLPLNLIVDEGPRGASLFVFEKTKDGHSVLYREKLMWSFDVLFLRIAAELGISAAAAKEMYRAYVDKAMSEGAARAFKKIIDPAVKQFLHEIGKGKIERICICGCRARAAVCASA